MIQYNIKNKDIIYLKLLWQIKKLIPIDSKDLISYSQFFMDGDSLILNISQIVFDSHIYYYTFSQIQSYINNLCEQIFENYNYNNIEQEYIKFYLLLRAALGNINYIEILYNGYIRLPLTSENNSLKREIASQMIYPFIHLKKDINPLIKIINTVSK